MQQLRAKIDLLFDGEGEQAERYSFVHSELGGMRFPVKPRQEAALLATEICREAEPGRYSLSIELQVCVGSLRAVLTVCSTGTASERSACNAAGSSRRAGVARSVAGPATWRCSVATSQSDAGRAAARATLCALSWLAAAACATAVVHARC